MTKPARAGESPIIIELENEKSYAWCACGKSNSQPWCNGSHSEGNIKPLVFKAESNKKAALCMCKETSNPPYCDGSHAK